MEKNDNPAVVTETSERGQPIPQKELDEIAKSIGGDTIKFYAVDQPRDDQGRFTDEGGGIGLKEDTGIEAPKVGEPFLVYRLGRGRPTLKNDNAGNSLAVATHLANVDDVEAPQPSGGTGNKVAAYRVVAHEKFGPYYGFIKGEPENDRVSKIGRDFDSGVVVHSFPKGGKYTSKKIAEVPVTRIRAVLKELHGTDDFNMAGAVVGAEAIRKAFSEK